MHPSRRHAVALALAEAIHTGIPLAPLPPEALLRSVAEGCRIGTLALEALDLAPCGLRLAPAPGGGMVAGPILEGRLLREGRPVALAMLHRPLVSPAVLGVLAADLPRRGDATPAFATLHPALDIAGWRLREPPTDAASAAADLAGLGLLVAGRGRTQEPAPSRLGFGPAGIRRAGVTVDLGAALAAAVAAARQAGGLPRGAVLVAALGPGLVPTAGARLSASFAGLGAVQAGFA